MDISLIRREFREPKKEFSPVPFWWWSGEPITKERLSFQLDRFCEGGIYNIVVINIAPCGPGEGNDADSPPWFSDAWWELFLFTCEEALKRKIYVWFYDQIGCCSAGLDERLIGENPTFRGQKLCWAPDVESIPSESKIIQQNASGVFYAVSYYFDFTNRLACKGFIDAVHGEVERKAGRYLGSVIVGSFMDELRPLPTWSAGLVERFRLSKGYDLIEHLDALRYGNDVSSVIVRADYRKVLAEMAEEAFFKPLYDWHMEHGLISGCDQSMRARCGDPIQAQECYHDYPLTHRWFLAPGSDHNGNAKLHSSLAHHYDRPRVWLEAFHSSGWGSSIEEFARWLHPWLQQGVTLYNPHSVYYSTFGGWWDWAAPDCGWRQPYWSHYSQFAAYISRLCWLLSLGHHVTEIAVLYPTASIQSELTLDGPTETAKKINNVFWTLTGNLSWRGDGQYHPVAGILREAGYDFDLIDEHILSKAIVEEGQLTIGDEQYRVLILPYVTLLTEKTVKKLSDFIKGGGSVIVIGQYSALTPALNGLFSRATVVLDAEGAADAIAKLVSLDVRGEVYALHRRVGNNELFFIVPKAADMPKPPDRDVHSHPEGPRQIPDDTPAGPPPEMLPVTFRASGQPFLWNSLTGQTSSLSVILQNEETTTVKVDFTLAPAAVVVFEKDKMIESEEKTLCVPEVYQSMKISTLWHCRYVPTMDNQFGDFTWPSHKGPIPIQTRSFLYRREKADEDGLKKGWYHKKVAREGWQTITASFGPHASIAGPIRSADIKIPPEDALSWREYIYSERYGIEKDPWHRYVIGTKGRVPKEFIDFGEHDAGTVFAACTYITSSQEMKVYLRVKGTGKLSIYLNGDSLSSEKKDSEGAHWYPVQLVKGENDLRLWFVTEQCMRQDRERGRWRRGRCFYQFLPKSTSLQDFPLPHPLLFGGWLRGEPAPKAPISLLRFDTLSAKNISAGWYRFIVPPGVSAVYVPCDSSLCAWLDDVELLPQKDGGLTLPHPEKLHRCCALRVEEKPGRRGGAVFDDFLTFPWTEVSKGVISVGNWCEQGLDSYSGGLRYEQTVEFLPSEDSRRVLLDLGKVRGTAEVMVNDKLIGVRLWWPYRFDVTDTICHGPNKIVVTVYNTLGPHFCIGHPSPYGFPEQRSSGIFGPVRFIFFKRLNKAST